MLFRTCLAAGAVALCGALTPASAEPLAADTVSKLALGSEANVAYSQYQRGFRRYGYGGRGYYGRRYYGRRYYRRGYGSGALIGGLAAGALIGGAIASQARPAAPFREAVSYCMQRFKSYDPASGTYLGYDGQRHSCP